MAIQHYPKTLQKDVDKLMRKEAKEIIETLLKASMTPRQLSHKEQKRAFLFLDNA